MSKINKTIKLGPHDTALVFREKGNHEVIFSEKGGEFLNPQEISVFTLLIALEDVELFEQLTIRAKNRLDKFTEVDRQTTN